MGPSWAILKPARGHLGLSWGHLGAILGLSWGHSGPFRGRWTLKNFDFPWVYKVFAIGPSFLQLRISYPILRHLIFLLGPFGVILGPFSTLLAPSWGCPGPSWGLHGATWAPSLPSTRLSYPILRHLLFLLGPLGVMLEPFSALLAPSWRHLGAILGHLEPLKAILVSIYENVEKLL